jgi:hypothetical protein
MTYLEGGASMTDLSFFGDANFNATTIRGSRTLQGAPKLSCHQLHQHGARAFLDVLLAANSIIFHDKVNIAIVMQSH